MQSRHPQLMVLVTIWAMMVTELVPTSEAGLPAIPTPASKSSLKVPADWWSTAQRDIAAAEYHVTWQERTPLADVPAAYHAANRAQNLRTYFTAEGFRTIPRNVRPDEVLPWEWGLSLVAWGWEGAMTPVMATAPCADGPLVEYDRGDLVEWYVNDTRGLEQGFTVLGKPSAISVSPSGVGDQRSASDGGPSREGNGLLRLELALAGNVTGSVAGDGQAVDFLAPGGARVIHFGGLEATDATGRALPAWFETSDRPEHSPFAIHHSQFISIVVDDRDAVYPLTIDPLATSPSWTAESNQASAEFGYCVAAAGDVNGDGYSDAIVGARYYDNGEAEEGRVFVYHGSAAGLSASANWTAESNQATAYFGYSVATAGDVNGDGYGDVIVGAWAYDNGQADEGRVFLWGGSAAGLGVSGTPSNADWTAESNQASAAFGLSVATAGDVNGDGYSDVIVGATGYDNGQTNEGRVFVFAGSATGPSAGPSWTAESDQGGAYFGTWVATAGDVNGDGYSDVIVGAHYYDNGQTNEGGAFVWHGSSTGLGASGTPSNADWTAEGDQTDSNFGTCVATAGDVNGDGYSDVIVGAPNHTYGHTHEGLVKVFHGSAAGLSASVNWYAAGSQDGAGFGRSAGTAGDVNGDGYSDVIVGAPGYDDDSYDDEGRAFVWYGSSSGLGLTVGTPSNADWTTASYQALANFGYSVATAGDVNGDGYSDVIVGAKWYDNGQTDEGRAFVYHGSVAGLSFASGSAGDWTAESNQASASFGISVATAGDVNGDGYSDVLVGASGYDNGQTNEGRVFVFAGSATGPSAGPSWTAESDQAGASFGTSVATAGDVNGDGYSDVIVGATHYDNGETNEGRAFVWYGSSTGLGASGTPSNADWTAESNQASALFGYCVATAGDVNGDGFSDVIVGAHVYSNGESWEGKAFVWYGSSTGLGASGTPANADWTAESNQADAGFGDSVATAGDVNGDGFSDVIAGAPYYDNGETVEGRAFVYHGSIGGLSNSANWTAESNQESARLGFAVATAGDVNGDGFSDVIVGADLYDNGLRDEGGAFVWYGSSTGLGASGTPSNADWVAEGNQAEVGFGNSVDTAGDVNGDGYSDVIVGAHWYDNGESEEGAVFVYHGSAAGLSPSLNWVADGDQSGAVLGFSVATAGDVNGDGFSDVIVGAPYYDNGETDEGRAFVWYGNGGAALSLRPEQRRADNAAPLDRLGRSNGSTSFRLAEIGRSLLGRGDVKLQWEVKLLGTPFNGAGLQQSAAWIDTGLSGASLNELVSGLSCGKPYHWRVRTRMSPATSPFQTTGRWLSAFPNGWPETDVRTRYGTLGDMNCDCILSLTDVPAFVQALLDPFGYAVNYPLCGSGGGDVNADGSLNGADVQGFVDLLVP